VANSPLVITRSLSLADLLATAVSDGTYDDVIETAKTDATGQEAAATDIAEYGGAIWSNLTDDAIQRTVEMYYGGTKVWLVADATARDALGSDDALAVNDLAFQIDTLGINYCTAVTGAATSTWAAIAATGNVAGPGASTDNAVMRWDGAGGATAQNSVVIISDAGAITGVTDITLSGTIDGRNVSADGTALDAHIASIANPHSTLLSQALAAGNSTQANDIEITNGDSIVGEDGGAITFAAVTGVIGLTETSVTGDLAVSGKLSVAGLIDPTGLVLDEQAASPFDAAGKHTLWAKDTIPTTLWMTDDAGNDYQVGTASTAGLSAVLAINGETGANNIILTDGADILGEPGSASAGGPIDITGGAGNGTTNVGGGVTVQGGTGAVSGAGGFVLVVGGTGGGTSGAGGAAAVQGGDAGAGNNNGGSLTLSGGQASGEGAPGDIVITAPGAISGDIDGGSVTIDGGDGSAAGIGGFVSLTAGAGGLSGNGGFAGLNGGAGGSASGIGGSVFLQGGHGVASGGMGGTVEVTTGNAGLGAASGGALILLTGDGGATSGSSGSIQISTGDVTSGTRGTITFNASDVIVSNLTYHSVRGSTARGSNNTLIYRWSGVVDNTGTGITYTDSATDGGSWAITQDGIYCVSVSIDVGHNGYVAIKKAAAVSNTFDATDIQVAVEAITGNTVTMTGTFYCASGSDIWIATSVATNPTGTPVNNNRVTVVRVR
jgi:hypothetical protein